LLDQGADVNNPPAEHEAPSPLQVCIECLDYEMMVQLLTRGADPRDSGALWMAVRKADLRSVNHLLDQNRKVLSHNYLPQEADPDYGCAALCEAVLLNQPELVYTFLEAGVDFERRPTQIFRTLDRTENNARSYSSPCSAILAAIKASNPYLLQIFLSQGKTRLREKLPESDGDSELFLAMHYVNFKHKDALEILKLLNGTVAKVNSYYFWVGGPKTVLQKAMECGCCSSVVDYLLSVGANINSPAGIGNGRTALQAAAEQSRDDIVEMLIKKGASVNAIPSSYMGATAFQFAAMNGNFEIVQLLLEAGADALAPRGENYGRTAIEGAAERGHLDMVLYLLHLANDVGGVEFEHQLCRARGLAWQAGHIALSETIREHQKDRYGGLHCERFQGYDADLKISGDDTSDNNNSSNQYYSFDDDDCSDKDDSSDNDSYICNIETGEQSKPGISTTSFASLHLPIRGPNIDGMPEVRELDTSMDCNSPNVHNIPTPSNRLRSPDEEDIENEVIGGYTFAPDGNPNPPESMGTLTQERGDNQIVDPSPFPDEYLNDFLDIPGSMATPQWKGFEVTEKYQTVTHNDPNPPEFVGLPDHGMQDELIVIPNLCPNDCSIDFLDIPGSMATPRWEDLDTFYDADMEE
jgi:ankyrin repeat protein